MSKYVIEIEDEPYVRRGKKALYMAKGFNSLVFDQFGLDKLTPLDKELDEAYQKGLHDGTARNENGCVGCIYDNGRIDHSPCDYCCNAYSNQWLAKEKSDEIKVGDEVAFHYEDRPDTVVVVTRVGENGFIDGMDGKGTLYAEKNPNNWTKTGRYFPLVEELLKAMNGEQRNCSTCKHLPFNSIECTECFSYKGYNRWEPKEGAE